MTGDMDAACAGHPEPLWDAHVDGEQEPERLTRHRRALAICGRCPARAACAAEINRKTDDGVWAGEVLPTIHDSDRRSPYADGIPPEREGRVPMGDPGALVTCDECGRAMAPKSMARHRQRFHATAGVAA